MESPTIYIYTVNRYLFFSEMFSTSCKVTSCLNKALLNSLLVSAVIDYSVKFIRKSVSVFTYFTCQQSSRTDRELR